ncbi:RNA polymerase sigma factor [Rhizobium sp. NTR19]|uniref:RNA polymerase sigma factor n=1 Tax=Neorhizobium turbinariae TaxID=2937795 RepID=A0ABT0INU0_9HYPH|nr:RNA polymerase sigma factor [Neorhizobium turbinariae]MCK8779547.1 RNA polymerase sigma factor [Neorhizobium turbinariae]
MATRQPPGAAPLSFELQVLTLLPGLRRYSRSLTRSDSESDDLLQDSLEKALANRGQWRGGSLKSWIYRIMTNVHLNTRRALARRPSVPIEAAENAADEMSPGDPLERRKLIRAVDALPKDARAVLMLVVVEGYSYQEVADILEVPVGTVMSRLSRARHALQDKLQEDNVVPLRRTT